MSDSSSNSNPCHTKNRNIIDVALEIARILTGQCRFRYHKDREARIQEDLMRITNCLKNVQVGEEHALRAIDNVNKVKVVTTYPCYQQQQDVERCYQTFKDHPISCSKLVEDFSHCINCTKLKIIKKHLFKESRE